MLRGSILALLVIAALASFVKGENSLENYDEQEQEFELTKRAAGIPPACRGGVVSKMWKDVYPAHKACWKAYWGMHGKQWAKMFSKFRTTYCRNVGACVRMWATRRRLAADQSAGKKRGGRGIGPGCGPKISQMWKVKYPQDLGCWKTYWGAYKKSHYSTFRKFYTRYCAGRMDAECLSKIPGIPDKCEPVIARMWKDKYPANRSCWQAYWKKYSVKYERNYNHFRKIYCKGKSRFCLFAGLAQDQRGKAPAKNSRGNKPRFGAAGKTLPKAPGRPMGPAKKKIAKAQRPPGPRAARVGGKRKVLKAADIKRKLELRKMRICYQSCSAGVCRPDAWKVARENEMYLAAIERLRRKECDNGKVEFGMVNSDTAGAAATTWFSKRSKSDPSSIANEELTCMTKCYIKCHNVAMQTQGVVTHQMVGAKPGEAGEL